MITSGSVFLRAVYSCPRLENYFSLGTFHAFRLTLISKCNCRVGFINLLSARDIWRAIQSQNALPATTVLHSGVFFSYHAWNSYHDMHTEIGRRNTAF